MFGPDITEMVDWALKNNYLHLPSPRPPVHSSGIKTHGKGSGTDQTGDVAQWLESRNSNPKTLGSALVGQGVR